jgi:hypothetical protein
MIVVEERIKEVLENLPIIEIDFKGVPTPFKHVFDWGSSEDLNIFLSQEKKIYPLIWLETGFAETHNSSKSEVSVSLSFKIATYGLDNSLLNQVRLKETFQNVLFPTLENIRKSFERSNIVALDGTDWNITKFYNYGTGSKTETTDVWDALKFDVSLIINNDCIKQVNYG